MKHENPNDFIAELSKDLAPVKSQGAVLLPALVWFIGAVLFVFVTCFSLLPVNQFSMDQLTMSPRFAAEIAVGLLSVFACIYASFSLSIPSDKTILHAVRLPLLALLAWLMLYGYDFLVPPKQQHVMEGKTFMCHMEIIAYSVLPIIFGMIWVNRQWALYRVWSAMFLALAAGILPSVAMQLFCVYELWHIVMHHLLPVMLIAFVAILLSRWLIKKK